MKGGVTMSDSSDSPIDPTGLASGKDEHIKPEWVQQLGLIFKKYKLTNHDYNVTLEIFNGALSSEVQQGVEKAQQDLALTIRQQLGSAFAEYGNLTPPDPEAVMRAVIEHLDRLASTQPQKDGDA